MEVGFDEVWTASYPFDNAHPLLYEQGYSLGQPIWSHNGQWLAYSRTVAGCPTPSSSIWISRSNGSEARQVSKTVAGNVNPNTGDCSLTVAHPATAKAWSADDKWLAVNLNGASLLSIETGQERSIYPKSVLQAAGLDTEYARQYLNWRGFAPNGSRALLGTIAEDPAKADPVYLVMELSNPDTARLLKLPAEIASDHGLFPVWSPDGGFLLWVSQTETESRLWLVDPDSGESKIALTRPTNIVAGVPARFDTVSWSPDSHWVEWDARIDSDHFTALFINTETWEVAREVSISTRQANGLKGWVRTAQNSSRFMVWDARPGAGLYLIDPSGQDNDYPVIRYDMLATQIPRIAELNIGPWQP